MEGKNLGEQAVYESPWFRVNLADVELPDGRHLDHFVIRQRAVALTAAVNAKDEVLLLWRHRFITQTWGWELPAGVVEDGESVVETAAREMLEETGWRAGPLQHLMTVEPANGLSDVLHHIYWADGAEYVGQPVDDFESDRREWLPLKRMPDLMRGVEIKAANTVAALLLLHQMLDGDAGVGQGVSWRRSRCWSSAQRMVALTAGLGCFELRRRGRPAGAGR